MDVRTRALGYAPDAKRRTLAQLKGYQVMPDEELFIYQRVELQVPPEQIISHPNARAHCAVCGEEIINQREVEVNKKVMCQTCAGRGVLLSEMRHLFEKEASKRWRADWY